ncbi:MAG: alkaline phosphatase [Treponema sp.]|nr:alkaline phosphatase [Treponema sp.]
MIFPVISCNFSKKKLQSYSGFWCTVLCILVMSSGCAGTPKTGTSLRLDALPDISIPAEHIVFIGLDGWGGAYVSKANMPTVKRMIAGGASSMDMRCILPSISWPNWATLFCGTPPEQRNGETDNNVSSIMDYPTIFTLVKNRNRTRIFFYEWDALYYICTDEEAEKVRITSSLESAQKAAAYIIEKKPVFTAVAFNEPDSTGHKKRWGSRAYYDKLAELDSFIAIIEQAVKDAGIYDSTVFIVSADHGGDVFGHGQNFKKHRQIPIVIYGRGIKNGYTIPAPLSICDIAPTMAAIMGLDVPSTWMGRPLKEVFK